MKREPLTRGEKILAVASLVVVTVLVGGMAFLQQVNAEPPIAYPPQVALPSPNGFDVYAAAGKSVVQWKPPVDSVSDLQIVADPKVRAKRYGLKRREAWLRANANAFALFKTALPLPCRSPNPRGNTLTARFSNLTSMRNMARFKTAEANTFKLRGEWDGAIQSGMDTIQMGIDIPRGGAYLEKMLGAACVAIGKASIEDVPDHLTGEQARATARRLESLLARRVSYREMIGVDKWKSVESFINYTRTENWRQFDASKDFTIGEWVQRHVVSKTAIVLAIEQEADDAMVDAQKPFSAPLISSEKANGTEAFAEEYSYYSRAKFDEAREKTGLELFMLTLALRAYTVDHGAPPQALKQLAPAYIKTVPRDIFADHAPLHYFVKDKRYTLWSVGPDMKNDGGRPVPPLVAPKPGLPRRLPPIFPDSVGDWVAGKNR